MLGAGASKDAGLPITNELFELLERSFEDELNEAPADVKQLIELERALLSFVRNRMQKIDSVFFDPNNFEDVVTTIDELGFRFRNRLFPFVDSWTEELKPFDVLPNSNFDEIFRTAEPETKEQIRTFAKQMSREPQGLVFQRLAYRIRKGIRQWLVTDSYQINSNYLAKLADFGDTVDVFTLNYDLTVEAALTKNNISYSTGFIQEMMTDVFSKQEKKIGVWNPEESFKIDTKVKLHKLHGSLSWFHSRQRDDQQEIVELPSNSSWSLFGDDFNGFQNWADWDRTEPPAMVFGVEHKLVGYEPYLTLFSRFAQKLRTAELLVVIGCQWRNEKIAHGLIVRELLKRKDPLTLIEVTKSEKEPFNQLLTCGAKEALESGALKSAVAEMQTARIERQKMQERLSGTGLRHWEN